MRKGRTDSKERKNIEKILIMDAQNAFEYLAVSWAAREIWQPTDMEFVLFCDALDRVA